MAASHAAASAAAPPKDAVADRRIGRRLEARLNLRILLTEDRMGATGHTVNVSATGALIRTAAPLRVGACYNFYFQDPDGLQQARARVIRQAAGFLYAVQFEAAVPALAVSRVHARALSAQVA